MKEPTHPIYDYLCVHGGWITVEGISTDISYSVRAVERALYRWQRDGLVEVRTQGGRREWRATP